MSALDEAGGERIPNRRITADSFRLLQARLQKKPAAAIVKTEPQEPQPEPVLPPPAEIIQETYVSAAVETVAPGEDLPTHALDPAPVDAVAKKPWAWLIPADAGETPAVDPLTDIDAPMPAAEAAEPARPEPEIAYAEPAPAEPAPELASAQPELPSREAEPDTPEPDLAFAEPEAPPPEVETATLEPDIVFAEPELPPPEVETATPEPELVAAEPEALVPETVAAAPVAELASPDAEPAVSDSAVTSSPAEIENPAAASEKPPGRRKSQLPNGKLGDDLLPVSGIVVHGIGEVAKAIYMTPTSNDRADFLAEVAAMAAAEAAWEQQRTKLPSIIQAEIAPKPKPKIRKAKPVDDPFAKLDLEGAGGHAYPDQTDDDAGELARSLLDMMLSNPSAGQPQERALAADALLKLVPRIPLRSLVSVVDRLSLMEDPPHLLVSKLIHDPRIEVAGPVLENCNQISDQVLGKVIATGKVSLQRLIARRRHISATLSDQLIEFDDPSVILTLVRNSGAAFSHQAFPRLAEHAQRNPAALAPFATRADLPAPIAFELFWFVPAELRRYLLSRFLTDSETLTKILKITHAMGGGEQGMEIRFPEREKIEVFVELLNSGKFPDAAGLLAEIAGIHTDNAARIIADANGEPLTIALKAIGTNRVRFGELIEILKASDYGIIASTRSGAELQNIFDSLSFNKARVLLTYWDWAVLKSGPYAPAN